MRIERLPASDLLPEALAERIAAEDECVIGADVGGTKTAVAALDPRGAIIMRRDARSPAADPERMVSTTLELVSSCIDSAQSEGFTVLGVGIGAAGFILHEEGVVLGSPNIAWTNVPLRMLATEATSLPAFLDNDANAAAAGEHLAGACKGVDDFIYLTLGTGIGGGIFIRGKLYRGHRGTAAELGHMTVDPNGPMCGCGRRGCLEAMASGTALVREARELAAKDGSSFLLEMGGGDPSKIDGEMVSVAAERGDPAACEAFRRIGYWLGLGVVNLIHAFDPEMVVLGGGVARSGHHLLDELERAVSANGLPTLVRGTSIALSTLGGDAGVIGAGAIAWEGIGAPS